MFNLTIELILDQMKHLYNNKIMKWLSRSKINIQFLGTWLPGIQIPINWNFTARTGKWQKIKIPENLKTDT